MLSKREALHAPESTAPGTRLRRIATMLAKIVLAALLWIKVPLPIRAARWLTARRMRTGRLRTVWGITPILTLPLLSGCDRLLGLRSESLVFVTYYISRQFDVNLSRINRWVIAEHPRTYVNFTRWVLAWSLLRYDVFHLFNDRGVHNPSVRIGISPVELAALKRAGKRLYTYAYGADVRTRARTLALGKFNLCAACPQPGLYCQCDDAAGEANITAIGRYANAMVATGDMLAYVPGARSMPYWPLDVRKIKPSTSPRRSGPLRVAHAPNHAYFKGTAYLEKAIEALRAEGCQIELVLVQGVPNSDVLDLFRDADIVADQFIAGFHGYTALEAMALGKPVLCYLRGPDMAVDFDRCPIIRADPDTLETVLRDCLTGKLDLAGLGLASRRYVEAHYSQEAIASKLGELYLETAELSGMTLSRVMELTEAARLAAERYRA